MNENEIWLPIEGYEGLYQVSNLGKVKSLKYDKEKILKQWKNNNGYLMVVLCKEGKRKNYYTHRLVAETFIANPNNLPTVNHRNEDKTCNIVENLEWMTYKDQNNYGTHTQRISKKLKNGVLSKKVFQYTKDGTLVAIWESTRETSRNGFQQGSVASCCRGELKSHRGYIWSYTELNKKQD